MLQLNQNEDVYFKYGQIQPEETVAGVGGRF